MAVTSKLSPLSQLLRERRIGNGRTQLETARALGHSTAQYVSNFERGLCEPSIETAVKLCEFLGISKRELYDLMILAYENEVGAKIFKSRSRKA